MDILKFKIERSAIIMLSLLSGLDLAAQVVHDSVFADNYFHSVFFTDPDNGYIAGDFGAIYRTTDGGCNWSPAVSGSADARLLSVFFSSTGTGYVAGRDYVSGSPVLLKTVDGGTSWDPLDIPSSSFDYITAVHFLNDLTGFVCGDFNTIMKTTDGGDNWEIQTMQSATYDPQFNDIFFLNNDTGFAVSGTGSWPSTLAKTYDGGSTWEIDVLPQAYHLSSIQFINDSVGYCGGYDQDLDGILLRTSDGGATWGSIPLGSDQWMNDLHFSDALNGYIAITGGLLRTADGGVTWTTIYEHQNANGAELFISEDEQWHLAISALDFSEFPPGFLGIAATSRNCSAMGVISGVDPGGIILYPNPASDLVHLVLPRHGAPAIIHVYDASGRRVRTATVNDVLVDIDVSMLRNGLYSIVVDTELGSTTRMISVVR